MNIRLLIAITALGLTTTFAQAQEADTTRAEEPTKATQLVGPFTNVEQMPEFPGGKEALQQFISKNLTYPVYARTNKISGQVITQFIITKTGDIKNARVLSSVCYSLDKAALRLIGKMPKWEPGMHKGEAVDVYFTLPIQFVMNDETETNAGGENEAKTIQTNSPLYIIDGKESTQAEFKAIDKSGIKSFVFMIPEKAKKQYGENGKNGAIVIELKKE